MDHEAETLQGRATSPRRGGRSSQAADEKSELLLTDAVIAALRTVYDPEIPVNIYDLGLIYRIAWPRRGLVEIDMTLTAPGCPVAGEVIAQVQRTAAGVEGVGDVKVNLVFDPPWDMSKMSEDARFELGLI